MDFLDPVGEPLVTPRALVKSLTRRRIGDKALQVDACVLMVVLRRDLKAFSKVLGGEPRRAWRGFREVCRGYVNERGVTLARSAAGAPNTVALAEELASFGMQKLFFVGYCGSLQKQVKAGDIVVPTEARREEGTSYHYLPPNVAARPDREFQQTIIDVLKKKKIPCHQGPVWSTDAIYRETKGKVARYQAEGVLGVEMEFAALCAFGVARGVSVGGVLVAADELFTGAWKPRFFTPRFLHGIRRTHKIVVEVLQLIL